MAMSAIRLALAQGLQKNSTRIATAAKSTSHFTQEKLLEEFCKCSFFASKVLTLNHIPTLNFVTVRNYSSKRVKYHTENKYKTDSDSDGDVGKVLGHKGETDFWRRKMRTFHGILDVNKDGVISFDDFQLLAKRFVDLGHLSEKHTEEFHKIIKSLWEKRWGEISPYNLVTVEQYMEDMHHVVNDKTLLKRAHSFLPYLFKAVDKDHDGVITVKEFKLFFECLGLTDEDAVFTFRTIDTNCDGKVTLKEFVGHGKEFLLSEDEENMSKYFWGPLADAH